MYAEDFNFDDLISAIENESDLGIVITGAVVVEYALRRVLETLLSDSAELKLFDEFRPLGPYRAKLDMCLALRLIAKELWSDLKTVNDLRNDAAHLKRGPKFSLSESPFKERIAGLHEIELLRSNPYLLQQDLPIDQRTGVLYEGARSQLHWSLIELLIKLQKIAPPKLKELPALKYEVGDSVKVRLHPDHKVSDLRGRSDASGTVIETPGNLVYNVLLDDPPDPRFNTLTYLTEDDIIEKLN